MTAVDSKVTPCPSIDLNGKKSRKPVPLTPYQAYSALFFTKGSPLHVEVTNAYLLWTQNDPTTRAKYNHILPVRAEAQKPMSFLTFQQAVMRAKVLDASEDELAQVEQHICARLELDNEAYGKPWFGMSVDEDGSPEDLERQYATAYVAQLLPSCATTNALDRLVKLTACLRPSNGRWTKLRFIQVSTPSPSVVVPLQLGRVGFASCSKS